MLPAEQIIGLKKSGFVMQLFVRTVDFVVFSVYTQMNCSVCS